LLDNRLPLELGFFGFEYGGFYAIEKAHPVVSFSLRASSDRRKEPEIHADDGY
jgi:hypothetical protein